MTRSLLAALLTLLLLGPGAPVRAQIVSPAANTPAEAVQDFNRAFQSYVWDGLAQRVHPEGLAYLRIAVDILVDYDDTGYFLTRFARVEDSAAYRALPDDVVLVRAMEWVEANAPGILSSFSGRRTEVLGVIPEGEDRHVLYRTIQIAQGAEPELRVLTVTRAGDRWRVRRGQDLRSLHTAFRGIPRPPGGDAEVSRRPPA